MAFRLPSNLTAVRYQAVSPGDVTPFEESLPPRTRVLVGLVFAGRYEGFPEDCERAEALLRQAGIPAWPEYGRFVTPDPDGEPIAWVSYCSSPAFWTTILLIIGGIFLLPIISILPLKIIDLIFPGAIELITSIIALMVMGGVMMLMPKMLREGK